MRSLQNFLKHLEDPSPGFRCRAAGDTQREVPPWSMRVSHKQGKPSSAADLVRLKRLVGSKSAEVLALYMKHDGLKLYVGEDGTIALEFFPIRSIEARTRKMKSWGDGFDDEPIGKGRSGGVAIGGIGQSPDYFAVLDSRIFFVPHDSAEESLGSLGSFLTRLARNPAAMLARLGARVRYFDGKTGRQWVAEKYQADTKPTEPPKGVKSKPHRMIRAVVRYASGKILVECFHNQGGGMSARDCCKSILETATDPKVMTMEDILRPKRLAPELRGKPLVELNPEFNRMLKIEFFCSDGFKDSGKENLFGKDMAAMPPNPSANQLAEWLTGRVRQLMADSKYFPGR